MTGEERQAANTQLDQIERALAACAQGDRLSLSFIGAIGQVQLNNVNGGLRERIELALRRELIEIGQRLGR